MVEGYSGLGVAAIITGRTGPMKRLLFVCVILVGGIASAAEVQIGPGGQLILGGFDPATKGDVTKGAAALERDVAKFKEIGATSHEVYVRWNLCEVEPGKWDW